MTIQLINARPSPYGRKAAIALIEKAIPYEVTYDMPWGDGTCTPQYSPLEQLPILILDNGETVYDSSFILDWLELAYPEPPLMPSSASEEISERKLKMLGERLMEVIHSITFEYQRPDPGEAWIDRQSRKVLGALAAIDSQIGARRPGPGEALSLGDIAVGTTLLVVPFLIENKFVEPIDVFNWQSRHPNLVAYTDALERRDSFQKTRPAMMEVDLKAVMG